MSMLTACRLACYDHRALTPHTTHLRVFRLASRTGFVPGFHGFVAGQASPKGSKNPVSTAVFPSFSSQS